MAWTKYNDGTQDYWYDDATGTISLTDPGATQSSGLQFSSPDAGQQLIGMFTAGNGQTQPLDYDPSTLWQASDGRWYAKKNDGSIGNILDYTGTLVPGSNSDVLPKSYIESEIQRGIKDSANSLANYGPLIVGGLATGGALGLWGGAGALGDAGIAMGAMDYTAPTAVGGFSTSIPDQMAATLAAEDATMGAGAAASGGQSLADAATAFTSGTGLPRLPPGTQTPAPVEDRTFPNTPPPSSTLSTLGSLAKSAAPALAAGGLLGALTGSKGIGGSTSTTIASTIPPLSQEEKDLIDLNKQLAQKQIESINSASTYQKQYNDLALAELQRQQKASGAYDAINTPEKIAADAETQRQINTLQLLSAQQAADRAAKLGPVQQELLDLQLQQLRQGGRATPEQLASIKAAADAGIASGNFDIDAATQRGIGLISDQLANSRGLRLTDSPMSSEAAMLSREGLIQKGALERSLRGGQATAALNYPLAVQQVQTAGIQGQQSIADAAANFQAQLQQQAYANRLALTGGASSSGIGLAGINSGSGALSALTQARLNSGSTTSNVSKGIGLSDIGNLAQGLGTGYLAYNSFLNKVG